MNDSTQKWLVGCGAGCLVLVLLAVLAGYGTFQLGREMISTFEDSQTLSEEVAARHGRIADFTPEPSGHITAGQIENFLLVRQRTRNELDQVEISLARLSGDSGQSDPAGSGWLARVYSGVNFLPAIAKYLRARNQALLESEIGMGEYLYIYSLAFYVNLGRSPADGPAFTLEGGDGRGDKDEFEVREERRFRIQSDLNRLLLPAMRNQLAKLEAQPATGIDQGWKSRLLDEIELMERDSYRIPWSDGLPEAIAASLAPFRKRLESSYAPMTNAIEIQRNH